jgi:NADPH:quinone reductase-like Zn-dependent oxidoreductase
MKTLRLSSFGAPTDAVELAEVDPPVAGPGQLAVSTEAARINPSNLTLIREIYRVRPELPAALGAEGVGRVIAVGDGVDGSRGGTWVLVVPTLEQATWREQTVIDERNAVPVDRDGDPLQLAMLGINPITAYCLLHSFVKLAPGWMAQTDASSATAGYVLALAKHAGLRTPNVVRRAESVKPLVDAGADFVLVEGTDLKKRAADAIGEASLELILDAVAGEPVAELASLLKISGQIISYTDRARQPLSIPVVDLIFRGLSVHGHWMNLWLGRTPRDIVAQTYQELAGLVAGGTLFAQQGRPTHSPITAKRSPTPPGTTVMARCSLLSDDRRTADRVGLRSADQPGQRGARFTQRVAGAADHRVDDRAVQEHQHDLRSLLGVGHANFGEQRSQFAVHSVLVRDNHRCCRVIVVGHVKSGTHVWAADEAAPEAIGDARGVVKHGKQPIAGRYVRRVAEQQRAVTQVLFRQCRGDELILAGEVAIQRHLARAGALGDRGRRGGVKTPDGDELRGGLEDALACVSCTWHRTYDTLRSRSRLP